VWRQGQWRSWAVWNKEWIGMVRRQVIIGRDRGHIGRKVWHLYLDIPLLPSSRIKDLFSPDHHPQVVREQERSRSWSSCDGSSSGWMITPALAQPQTTPTVTKTVRYLLTPFLSLLSYPEHPKGRRHESLHALSLTSLSSRFRHIVSSRRSIHYPLSPSGCQPALVHSFFGCPAPAPRWVRNLLWEDRIKRVSSLKLFL